MLDENAAPTEQSGTDSHLDFNVESIAKSIPEVLTRETFAKAPEWVKSLYTPSDVGYVYNPVSKMKKALVEERNNVAASKKELSEKLLAIEQTKQLLGLTPDKDLTEGVNTLKQELEIYKASKTQSEADLSARIQEYSNKHDSERSKLQIEFQSKISQLKDEYTRKETDLIKQLKLSKIGYDLKDVGADPVVLKYAGDKLLSLTKLNQDGELIVMDENGDPRLGSKGREMTFREYVDDDLRKDMSFAFPTAPVKETSPSFGNSKLPQVNRPSNGRPTSAHMFGLDGQIQYGERGATYYPKSYELEPSNLQKVKDICKTNGLTLSYNPTT